MKRNIVSLVCTLLLSTWIISCGGGNSTPASSNPVPMINTLSPSAQVAGQAAFTLSVTGSGFVTGSTVLWNGSSRATMVVSSTQLNANIPASDVVAAGSAQIAVSNPAPGGGTSGVLTFSINNPLPTVVSFSPPTALAGDPGFLLSLAGSNFGLASVVAVNGSARQTTFVDSSHLVAAISSSDIGTAGIVKITVANPSPGGGTSPALRFDVAPATPSGAIYLYVSDVASHNIFGYSADANTGVLTAIPGSPFASSTLATQEGALLLDRSGEFLYAINNATSGCKSCDSFSGFMVGSTGVLTPLIGSPFSSFPSIEVPAIPVALAQDPSGNIIYSSVPGGIYSSLIDADTGVLSQLAVGSRFGAISSLAVHPSSAFIYGASNGTAIPEDAGIWAGSISPTTQKVSVVSGSPFGSEGISIVTLDPAGKFAFAIHNGAGSGPDGLLSFAVNQTSGALSVLNTKTFSFPVTLAGVLVHPSGRFLYVADQGTNTIIAFTIDANGGLTQVAGSPFSAGTGAINPSSLATDPAGKFLFVGNINGQQPNGSISVFTVDATTGALAPVSGSPFPTAAAPFAIVAGP